MADHTFQLEGNSVEDGPFGQQIIRKPGTQWVPRLVDFFAGLPYNCSISESVEDEVAIWAIMNEAKGRLSAGEDTLRLILDTTPALIHTGRPDGYLDYFNRRWLVFVGKSPEELCGWRWTDSVHPDDLAGLVQKWQAALASGEALEAEARVRRADGEYRLLLHRKVPLRDEQGAIVKWFGSSIDIEDRKRAEERIWQTTRNLQRSEFYLNEGQRLAHAGSWAFDSGGFDYWSPELFRIHGLDPAGKAPTVQEYLDLVHPEDREFLANLVKRILAEASPFDTTKRIVRPDGEVRYIRCVGAPVVENQRLKRFVGTAVDVTEHELLTQELRRREACLTQAEALSRTGSFGWNASTGDLYWSDENFRILEYERTVKPTLELLFKRFHPEDAATVQETIERALKDAKNLDFEQRLLMPNGSIKHVHVLAQPFKDQSGNVEFLGAVMDVTDSKKALQEIKALKDELYKENIVLREEVDKTSMFEEVVGTSPVLQAVLARAAKVAPTDSTVLITGETGTGKELIARAIHKRSQRPARAFVSVNCAAIPQSLITSELFGHEKGAFTGATQRRLGRFELAEGGTLFLDEIGELPVETQIALLRVLQEREFERVGGTELLRADVRVIAATNRDLQDAITAGTFRSDLFYRLSVFPIALPPLRDRKEDIPPLASYFVDRYAKRAGRKIRGIRKSALDSLQSYSWPGNIRELQNIIERSLIVCETDEFTIDQSWLSGGPVPTRSRDQASMETSAPGERELIEAALAQTKGKVSGLLGAAAKFGIPASTLESKIRSLKINKYRFKER
jgi:PAS domain S-box-containing protein